MSKRAHSSSDSSNSSPSSSPPREPTGKSSRSAVPSSATGGFTCTYPPTCSPSQPSVFPTSAALSGHYESHHAHVCSDCRRMFPSERYLDLHIEEWHNVLVELKREKGEKVYRCFEPSCARRFSTPKTRRLHLVDAHRYPRQFFFSLPKHGLNQLFDRYGPGASLVRPDWKPRQGHSSDASMDETSPESVPEALPVPKQQQSPPLRSNKLVVAKEDQQVADLSEALEKTKLDMVPKQVKFGQKRGGKAGFRGR